MIMRHLPPSWTIAALTVLLAAAAPTSASSVLTPQNFKDTIAHGVWFIEHFSPYCPHCRHFEPTWNEVVDHFEAMPHPGVRLAQVNCALNGDLCNENGITGYPQMNLYRDGQLVETYNADREFHLLVEFLTQHAQPEATSEDVPAPSTAQEAATPTPTPSPAADHLVVQVPRRDANPSGTVVPLDVQTFDSFLSQGPAFIKFFAPWCGHCKKLAPAWAQLGRRMQHKLNIAEVDCESHKALCTSQGVTGFPMMFYYAHGTKSEYTGGRSYDQLVSFADRASKPTMQIIDASQLEGAVSDNAVLYLLLHDDSDSRIVTDVAKGARALLGSPPVYVSTSPDLFRKYGLPTKTSSALLAFKDGDAREPIAAFDPTSSSDALTAWLHAHRFPSSLELSKDVFQQVMYAPHKPLVLIVATPETQRAEVSTKLEEIAKKWRLRAAAASASASTPSSGVRGGARDVVFTWMDAGQWGSWMKDMYGIKVQTEPVVVVADHERLVYYDRDASGHAIVFNSVSVVSALDAIQSGTARPIHSRTVLQRAAHSVDKALLWMQTAIPAHPYLTALVILGLAGCFALALSTLVRDPPGGGLDVLAEKRHAKRNRLD